MSKDKTSLRLEGIPLNLSAVETAEEQPGLISLLVFEIGDQTFAIGVESTEGVVDCPRTSPLPSPPDAIVGIASVRGHMTLVMDLSLGVAQRAAKKRLILVKGEYQLGLLADRIEGVVALTPRQIRATQARRRASTSKQVNSIKSNWPARSYFKRAGRQVPIVDVERLAEI